MRAKACYGARLKIAIKALLIYITRTDNGICDSEVSLLNEVFNEGLNSEQYILRTASLTLDAPQRVVDLLADIQPDSETVTKAVAGRCYSLI